MSKRKVHKRSVYASLIKQGSVTSPKSGEVRRKPELEGQADARGPPEVSIRSQVSGSAEVKYQPEVKGRPEVRVEPESEHQRRSDKDLDSPLSAASDLKAASEASDDDLEKLLAMVKHPPSMYQPPTVDKISPAVSAPAARNGEQKKASNADHSQSSSFRYNPTSISYTSTSLLVFSLSPQISEKSLVENSPTVEWTSNQSDMTDWCWECKHCTFRNVLTDKNALKICIVCHKSTNMPQLFAAGRSSKPFAMANALQHAGTNTTSRMEELVKIPSVTEIVQAVIGSPSSTAPRTEIVFRDVFDKSGHSDRITDKSRSTGSTSSSGTESGIVLRTEYRSKFADIQDEASTALERLITFLSLHYLSKSLPKLYVAIYWSLKPDVYMIYIKEKRLLFLNICKIQQYISHYR